MTVQELLAKPESWCQGFSYLDETGMELSPGSPGIVRRCLMGAIDTAYPIVFRGWAGDAVGAVARQTAINKLEAAIVGTGYVPPVSTSISLIVNFNDCEGRTHDEIMQVVRAAGI